MSSGINMVEYLDLYLQETEEQLAVLEAEIGKLYADPVPDRINLIFRAAHTIKGSSRAMGYGSFAELVHEFENVLFKVRDGSLTLTEAASVTLVEAVDVMAAAKEHIALSGEDYSPSIDLVHSLQKMATGENAPVVHPKAASNLWDSETIDAISEAGMTDTVFQVTVTLDSSCAMKYVRAFMVVSALNECGEILAMNPSQEDLEGEKFELSFSCLVHLELGVDEAASKLKNIGEVADVLITPFNDLASQLAEVTPSEVGNEDAPAKESSGAKKREASQTIRVDVSLLDNLMNLVGELVIDRTRLSQIGANIAAKAHDSEHTDALAETVGHIARVTSELQDQIMRARMLPIDTVFQRFPRMVRDLSRKLGKQVELTIEGGETEVDRSVIEGISDPLIHMIRNSLDHGLEPTEERLALGKPETGHISLVARHRDNTIWVEITDDGKGIDPDKLREKAIEKGILTREAAAKLTNKDAQMLIFSSGFSTAKEVTDVSGRGVGMDIVRANIQSMGGTIDIESTVGQGTKFILKLPLTIAIMGGLLAKVGEIDYVMPIVSVLETLSLANAEVFNVGKRPVMVLRGQTVPLLKIRGLFKVIERNEVESADKYVVVVGSAEQRVGLVVDRLLGEQEVVVKSISKYCGDLKGLSGATILGNGRVALIVDVNSILEINRGLENGH